LYAVLCKLRIDTCKYIYLYLPLLSYPNNLSLFLVIDYIGCGIPFLSNTFYNYLLYAAPLRAPKWYKRPVGASFGFGGKLVWFCPKPSAAGVQAGGSEVYRTVPLCSLMMNLFVNLFFLFVQVYVHNLVTEDSLVSRSSEFEAAIQNGERSSLRVLCEKKSQESEYVIITGERIIFIIFFFCY
jgi:hypothetical protein